MRDSPSPPFRQRLTITLDQEFEGICIGTSPLEAPLMSPSPATPILRVFHDDDAGPAPDESTDTQADERSQWRLRTCWEEWVLPKLKRGGRAKATIGEHRTALNHWEAAFRPEPPDPTKNPRMPYPGVLEPPISSIDFEALNRYVSLLQTPVEDGGIGCGFHQARKCLSAVRSILKEAVARNLLTKLPDDVEIVGKPPKARPGLVAISEVEALIQHGWEVAEWPAIGDIPPGFTWETWFLLFWIYGARTQDFVGYKEKTADGLLWESVHEAVECPDASARDERGLLTSPFGWLDWMPTKTARSKGERITLPLHSAIAARLKRFHGFDARRVFANGRTKGNVKRGWPGFLSTFHQIRESAGLGADVTIAGTGRGVRSIRKACSNNWDDLRDGLGLWVLGHGRQDVHSTHYKDCSRHIVKLIERLKLPRTRSAQRMLF